MLRAIIIDNDQQSVEYLQEHFSNIHVLKVYESKDFDTFKLATLQPELIFMNVDKPDCVNIRIIQYLANHRLAAHLIFIKESEDTPVKDDLQGEKVKYIQKPFTKKKIRQLEAEISRDGLFPIYPKTEINMFERFYFIKDGQEIKNIKFRTAKSRELLIYLIQHNEEFVAKDDLVALLWPDTEKEKAYDNLYAAIYYLRKLLSEVNIGIQIETSAHGYEVKFVNITCNVDRMEQLYEELDEDIEANMSRFIILKKFDVLKSIYRGDFLKEEPYEWAKIQREKCRIKFLSIVRKIMKQFAECHNFEEAITFALDFQENYPDVEYVYLALMKLYDLVGEPEKVEEQYNLLKHMLKEEFDTEPNPMIQNWYNKGLAIDDAALNMDGNNVKHPF